MADDSQEHSLKDVNGKSELDSSVAVEEPASPQDKTPLDDAKEDTKVYPSKTKLIFIELGLALAVFLYGLVSCCVLDRSNPQADHSGP
jgi:hypothetical protein